MTNTNCLYERTSKYAVAAILTVLAAILFISGITIFPIFGLILAIPVSYLAYYFYRAHLNKDCEIEDLK